MSTHFDAPPPTVVPKIRWRWVILGLVIAAFAGIQVYRVITARQLQAQLHALRAQGFPVTVTELQSWGGVVPDSENAAIKILEAVDYLALAQDTIANNRFPLHGEELGPVEREELNEILTNNAPVLEALHAAASLKRSRFPVDYSRGPNTLLPHLAKVKTLTQLLRAEVVMAAEEGKLDRAVSGILDSVALARSLDQEPLLISQLVRVACLSLTCSSLERLLTQQPLAPEQLALLAKAFREAREASPKSFQAGYLGEVCMATYFKDHPAESFDSAADDGSAPEPLRVLYPLYAWTGLRDRDLAFHLRTMREMLDAAILPFPNMLDESRAIGERVSRQLQDNKLLIVSRMILPSLSRASEKAADSEARLRCAEVALAIERRRAGPNGKLPEGLAALASELGPALSDPVDGQSLRFKRLEPGYMIYSVGPDRSDDGGLERGNTGNTAGRRKLRPQGSGGAQAGTGASVGAPNRTVKGADTVFRVDR